VPWGDAPYGDDPDDQERIKDGITYFREMAASNGLEICE
jgi:hypothetical protein